LKRMTRQGLNFIGNITEPPPMHVIDKEDRFL
jgi:hypothetical protein